MFATQRGGLGLKQGTLLMGIAALIYVASCQKNDTPNPEAQSRSDAEEKELKAREDVKALFPAAEWLETQEGEARFMFCANDLPAFGSSRIDIHGWVFRHYSNQWESVFTVRLNGTGPLKLLVDPKTGLFAAKGSANNKYLDKSVFTFDLRATEH